MGLVTAWPRIGALQLSLEGLVEKLRPNLAQETWKLAEGDKSAVEELAKLLPPGSAWSKPIANALALWDSKFEPAEKHAEAPPPAATLQANHALGLVQLDPSELGVERIDDRAGASWLGLKSNSNTFFRLEAPPSGQKALGQPASGAVYMSNNAIEFGMGGTKLNRKELFDLASALAERHETQQRSDSVLDYRGGASEPPFLAPFRHVLRLLASSDQQNWNPTFDEPHANLSEVRKWAAEKQINLRDIFSETNVTRSGREDAGPGSYRSFESRTDRGNS